MDDSVLLSVRNLTKNYGGKKAAVAGVDFSFFKGEFVGLLGPNGAGKTTIIKILTGLIKPSSGEVSYYGDDFFSNSKRLKAIIGVVPQQNNLDRDLTAYENLYLHCLLHGIPKRERAEKIEKYLTFAGLIDMKDKAVKTFSGGMMRRLVILRALLHEPQIIFLDEPTIGLDPQIRRTIWEFIVKINQTKNTTILLTTHYIEEAEKLCARVLIIDKGLIIAQGTPNELKAATGKFVLETFKEEKIVEEFFEHKEDAMEAIKSCSYACKIRESTLEDVFLQITGRKINV
ncbi:ABC transporter ATP-binding protein [Candidatus Magnetomonas plexicatena]|uniref:ABC transporter ATP-binding protein n=1 Tax=Candidatus Magnetomonas plexicatena TaxID=2552947 RepID=UPI001C79369E|nr:ABC transporter ATP-binding protein [Nitrospirales bacterium LBB_01]